MKGTPHAWVARMNADQDDDLYLLEQKRVSAAATTAAIESIKAGHPFSILLAEEDGHRAEALDTLLEAIANPTIRITHATNPLRAPLTLERLLIQIVPNSSNLAAGLLDQAPATIVRHIAEPHGAETSVLLVLEQAETLHPELLHMLGQASDHFADSSPTLQVLFVGRPAFQQLLAHPDAGFDRRTLLLEAHVPDEPDPTPAPPPQQPSPSPYLLLSPSTATPPNQPEPPQPPASGFTAELTSMWRQSVLNRLVIILGPLIALAAIATGIAVAVFPPRDIVQPEPVATLADRPAPGQADPVVPQPAPPLEEATAEQKREFEAYLALSGKNVDALSEIQTRVAYEDFLIWRARTKAP